MVFFHTVYSTRFDVPHLMGEQEKRKSRRESTSEKTELRLSSFKALEREKLPWSSCG